MPIRNRVVPTVPIWFIRKNCERGNKFLGSIASDRQAKLVSSLSVIAKVNSRLNTSHWVDGFNQDGIFFGRHGFKNLPSFCTL